MDFDEEEFEDGEVEEFDFDAVGTLNQLNDEKKIEQKEQKQEKKSANNKIEISVDSVQSLIANLSYSAEELEKAVDRVEKNRNLNKILDLLSQIKLHDFSSLEKKIDTKRIEESIKKTISNSINKTLSKIEFKKLEEAAKRYEKYGEVFASEEVMNTFDEIDDLEQFRKNFKFKSILSTAIITAVLTASIIFTSIVMFSDFTNSKITTGDIRLDNFISKSQVKYEVRNYADGMQLIFTSNKRIKYFEVEDENLIVIEYQK